MGGRHRAPTFESFLSPPDWSRNSKRFNGGTDCVPLFVRAPKRDEYRGFRAESVPLHYTDVNATNSCDEDMRLSRALRTALCLLILVASTQGYAQLYKWTDEQGKVHYGDKPPQGARLQAITGKVSSYRSVSVEPFKYTPPSQTEAGHDGVSAGSVVMYSTSWCGYCKKAAAHFHRNKIPFTEHDIEKSEQAALEYRKLKGRGVPVILIGKRRMNGFNAKVFDQIYYGKS